MNPLSVSAHYMNKMRSMFPSGLISNSVDGGGRGGDGGSIALSPRGKGGKN